MKFPSTLQGWLALALAVLAVFGVTVKVTHSGTETTISIGVQSSHGPTEITTTPADLAAVSDIANHDGAKDETPPAMSEQQVEQFYKQVEAFGRRDGLPLAQPDAAPEQPGCKSRFVSTKSSRGGIKPRWLVMHYTVSPNLPGTRDLEALTTYSNNPGNGVSWTFNIDRDGNCFYTVRETDKPWTQAAANPWSISTEIVNRGAGDRPLFTPNGLKKAARIWSDSAKRWDIPIRRGRVNRRNCSPTRSGILDHNDLGVCGGGHVDITPHDIDQIITAIRIYRQSQAPLERKIAKWCRSLKIVRAKIRARESNATQRRYGRLLKKVLIARGAECV